MVFSPNWIVSRPIFAIRHDFTFRDCWNGAIGTVKVLQLWKFSTINHLLPAFKALLHRYFLKMVQVKDAKAIVTKNQND